MKRLTFLIVLVVVVASLGAPRVSAASRHQGTLWDAYPKLPSTMVTTIKGVPQTVYLVAVDPVTEDASYVSAGTVQRYLAGKVRLMVPGLVTVKDFSELPATLKPMSVTPAPATECVEHFDDWAGQYHWSIFGYYYFALYVEWDYNNCSGRTEITDYSPQHDSLCWNCASEAATSGRYNEFKVWAKGSWRFTYSCSVLPIRSMSRWMRADIERRGADFLWNS